MINFSPCDLHPVSPRLRAALGRWSFLPPMQLALNCLDQPAPHDANHMQETPMPLNNLLNIHNLTQLAQPQSTFFLGLLAGRHVHTTALGLPSIHLNFLANLATKSKSRDALIQFRIERLEVVVHQLAQKQALVLDAILDSQLLASRHKSTFIYFSCVCKLL